MEKDPNSFDRKDGVSLEKHFETVIKLSIEDMNRYFESRIKGLEVQIIQAKDSMEHRLIGMNEIRSTLTDQAKTFPTKGDLRAETEPLKKEMEDFRKFKEDRSSVPLDIATLKEKMDMLISFKDTQSSKASSEDVMKAQANANRAYIVSIVSVTLTIITIMLTILFWLVKV